MTTLSSLREAYRDESHVEHLTAAAPPIVRQVIERSKGYDLIEEQEPADQIGRSLSATMVQLIGSFTDELALYPPRFPVRRALSEWDRICRRRHRGGLWWDHATPICSEMLRGIVEGGVSADWAIFNAGLGGTWSHYQRGQRLIGAGATFVSDRLAKWDDERLGITHDPKTCDICWRSAHETA